AFTFGRRLSNMIRVRAHAIAHHLGNDLRATLASEFEFLENENARTFADDEAVAVLVPGAAGVVRIVVACGERPHGRKPTHSHRRNRSFGATGNHHVGVAILDDSCGVSNGVRAGGTSGAGGLVRALGMVTNADLPGSEIDDGGRNKEG